MLIVCPNCSTSYDVGAAALGAGRSVRCASCRTVWFATPEDARRPAAATAPAPEMAGTADERFEAPPPADEHAAEDAWAEEPEAAPVTDWEQALGHDTDSDAADWIAEASPKTPSILPPDAEPESGGFEEGEPGQHRDTGRSPQRRSSDDMTFAPSARRRSPLASSQRRLRMAAAAHSGWRVPIRPLPTLIAVLAIAVIGLLFWRTSIVRLVPQTASFYAALGLPVNLRGVVFENVRTTQELHEGIPVLVVEGSIVGIGNRPAEAQRLRFSLRNEAGNEIYSWTALPSRSIVEPGDSVPFRSRLASPPAEGRDVVVRFFNRRDAATAVR